jgi:hypothetical protein
MIPQQKLGKPQMDSSNIFLTQISLLEYLKAHPKSKDYTNQLIAGNFSIAARKAITQVTVSKLIDIYGNCPSTAIKTKVSSWLADLMKMSTSDFFDCKTHKGFLNKDLENRRRKLPEEEKRWVWSKRMCFQDDSKEKSLSGSRCLSLSRPSHDGSTFSDLYSTDIASLNGCCRGVAECNLCAGIILTSL